MHFSTFLLTPDPGPLPVLLAHYVPYVQELSVSNDTATALELIATARADVWLLDDEWLGQVGCNPDGRTVLLADQWEPPGSLEAKGAQAQVIRPFGLEPLRSALDPFEQEASKLNRPQSGEMFPLPLLDEPSQETRMSIPVVKGFRVVRLSEVVGIASAGSYADFTLVNGQVFQASRSLKYFAQELEEYGFCRCHDSHLINVAHLQSYSRGRGGNVVLSGGLEVPVSRYRREDLMASFRVSGDSSASTSIEY